MQSHYLTNPCKFVESKLIFLASPKFIYSEKAGNFKYNLGTSSHFSGLLRIKLNSALTRNLNCVGILKYVLK